MSGARWIGLRLCLQGCGGGEAPQEPGTSLEELCTGRAAAVGRGLGALPGLQPSRRGKRRAWHFHCPAVGLPAASFYSSPTEMAC